MCHNGERGLQSILSDPDFATNQYLYVFYTAQADGCPEDAVSDPSNRLARFILDAATLQLDLDQEVHSYIPVYMLSSRKWAYSLAKNNSYRCRELDQPS
jgi:Glucose / Sorbosone dehydrogenase